MNQLEEETQSYNDANQIPKSNAVFRVIKSRRRGAGDVARMGERTLEYRVLVWKPEGKRLLGRPRRRWEDNIKMYLQELGWRGVWPGLSWLRIQTGGGHL